MTAFDRFEPIEQRLVSALEDIASTGRPDYLDDVFSAVARTPQRPRWTFPERWIPMDLATRRPMVFGRLPLRPLVLLVVLALLTAIAAALIGGAQHKLPPPFGPAANGQLAFGMNGDLYALDSLTSEPRLLVGGGSDQGGVVSSPDGQLIAYDNVDGGVDHAWVANADGSNPHQILDDPFTGGAATWSPTSKVMALVTEAGEARQLWLAPADGSGARPIDLGTMRPWDVVWDPQRAGVMLIRAEARPHGAMALYYIDSTGTVLSKISMTGRNLNGPSYEFSGLAMSPDGDTIAYNSVEAQEPPVNRFRVHLMNRDGTNDRPIPAPLETGYSQAWPIFSADGNTIAMESWVTQADDTAVNQIALAPADGSAVAHWIGPRVPGQGLTKTWSPDGTYLLVGVGDLKQVYSIDPVSGSSQRLPWAIDLPDVQRVATP